MRYSLHKATWSYHYHPIPSSWPHAFLQLDTEGTEATILLEGARRLLRRHRIRTILWEYGDKVNPAMFAAAKDGKPSAATPDQISGPTLKRIVAALLRLGYNSYLASGYRGNATFVPLTGEYWDDFLELCRAPQHKVCCYDILSTVAGGAADEAIRSAPILQRRSKGRRGAGGWKGFVSMCNSGGRAT